MNDQRMIRLEAMQRKEKRDSVEEKITPASLSSHTSANLFSLMSYVIIF